MKDIFKRRAGQSPINRDKSFIGNARQKNCTVGFEDIERRAYHIWQENGCRHGQHLEDWLQAQQELEAEENLPE